MEYRKISCHQTDHSEKNNGQARNQSLSCLTHSKKTTNNIYLEIKPIFVLAFFFPSKLSALRKLFHIPVAAKELISALRFMNTSCCSTENKYGTVLAATAETSARTQCL